MLLFETLHNPLADRPQVVCACAGNDEKKIGYRRQFAYVQNGRIRRFAVIRIRIAVLRQLFRIHSENSAQQSLHRLAQKATC